MKRIIGRISAIVLAVGLIALGVIQAPYVLDVPGPTFNVLGKTDGKSVIIVHDKKTYPVTGAIDALTVSQIGRPGATVSWIQVFLAYLDPSSEVIPLDVAYPPGVKEDQIYAEDAAMMQNSQQDAQAAALTYLGIDYQSRVYVESMMTNSAAKGLIFPGDYIDSVNGEKVSDNMLLRERVKAWDGNEPLLVGVTHKGKQSTVKITPHEVDGEYFIGVYVTYKYVFPFKIDVDLGDVGGPSAGTMFALGIIDKLTPGPLTGGLHIAGTGTIEPTGEVGPIGGIVQKMYGAKKAGAKIFLAPSDNCSETLGKVPGGLQVYRIAKLKDAVKLLTAVQNGASLSGFATCEKK